MLGVVLGESNKNVKGKERASEEEIASWSLAADKADLLALGYNVDLDRIELRTLAMELETRTAQWRLFIALHITVTMRGEM